MNQFKITLDNIPFIKATPSVSYTFQWEKMQTHTVSSSKTNSNSYTLSGSLIPGHLRLFTYWKLKEKWEVVDLNGRNIPPAELKRAVITILMNQQPQQQETINQPSLTRLVIFKKL